MSRASWTSAALALLLIISLTGKFVVGHGAGQTKDDQRLARDIQQRLIAGGFATSIEPRIGGLVVHGTRGSCRLTARDGDGWSAMAVVFQERARPYGPLRYVYRGSASADPPRLRPVIDVVTGHVLRRLGIGATRPALLAVAAAPSCGAVERLFDGITVWRPAS